MTGGIFLIKNDGDLIEMTERDYNSEDLLQQLLAKYPSLLAGDQINPSSPRRWLLITREASIPSKEGGPGRWSIDHLFLDQDAVPTLVEVKRSSDTRIRREVVGQMLDYAANAVVYWPVEEIKAKFESHCESHQLDSGKEFDEFSAQEIDQTQFWQNVKTNLQAGKVRLVFVADKIPSELRRIVEFMNEQMDPAEVLAVEIKQFVGKNLKTMVPRVIGQTESAQQKKGGGSTKKQQWDEESFKKALHSKRGIDEMNIAESILKWAKDKGLWIYWGTGEISGSYTPHFQHKGKSVRPFSIYTDGYVEIKFQWLKERLPFDEESKRLELLNKLNEIPGAEIPEYAIGKRPWFYLSVLKEQEMLEKFFAVIDWVIEETKST